MRIGREQRSKCLWQMSPGTQAIIRAHVLKRQREDQVESDISVRVAEHHPLWPGAFLHAKPIKSPALSYLAGSASVIRTDISA